MPDNDDLDLLIESALASYSDAEEPPFLVARTLASVKQERSHRASSWRMIWTIAVPIAAVLLLGVLFSIHRFTPQSNREALGRQTASSSGPTIPPTPQSVEKAANAGPQVARTEAPKSRRVVKVIRPATQVVSLPKQEVFPGDPPLSPEERSLVALANSRPSISSKLAHADQPAGASLPPVQPLNIAAITVSPLNPPDKGGN